VFNGSLLEFIYNNVFFFFFKQPMTLQRQEIKERLDAAPHNKTIVDLDEIIEKWVS